MRAQGVDDHVGPPDEHAGVPVKRAGLKKLLRLLELGLFRETAGRSRRRVQPLAFEGACGGDNVSPRSY